MLAFCSVAFLLPEARGSCSKSDVTNGTFLLTDGFFLSVNWSCAGAGKSICFWNIISQTRLHVLHGCFN